MWTIGCYLKQWSFSPQKPLRRAYKQNPRAVRQWLDEEYPAIARCAKRVGAVILLLVVGYGMFQIEKQPSA